MATIAQINANQQNAQLSTGPITPAGIDACRFNATKHGLTGKQIVTRDEDPAAYEATRQSFIESYAPTGEKEAVLVEEIAQNWWRLQRARRTEAEIIGKFGALECMTDPIASKAFDKVQRYVRSIERAFNRARYDLKQLQDARAKADLAGAALAAAHQEQLEHEETFRGAIEYANNLRKTQLRPPTIGSVSSKPKVSPESTPPNTSAA